MSTHHTGGDDLRRWLNDLRGKLDIIESEIMEGEPGADPLRAIEEAVSTVRRNLWHMLSTNAADYHSFLGAVRVRRAAELCEEVLADLHADTLPANTPGMQVFDATLRELSAALRRHIPHRPSLELGAT